MIQFLLPTGLATLTRDDSRILTRFQFVTAHQGRRGANRPAKWGFMASRPDVPARQMSGVQHAAVVDAPLRGAVAPGATQVSHRQDEIRDARHDLGPKA